MEEVASDSSVVSEVVEMAEEDEEEEEIEEIEEEIMEEEIEEMEEEVEEGAEEAYPTISYKSKSSVGSTASSTSTQKSPKSSSATQRSPSTAVTAKASSSSSTTMLEGSNIHFSADGKKLCSHSTKVCKQRRMEGRGFCIKHILEDPTSGFQQCEYLCKKKGNRRCTNPVPPPHDDVVYCSHHRQILGLQPRTAAKRGQGKAGGGAGGKSRADLRSNKGAHTALMSVLAKHGIPEKSPKRKGATTPNTKKIKSEETQSAGAAEEEQSSDEFPSDEEENGEEADVESGSEDAISDLDRDYDNDAFIPDSFLWHLEHDSAPESDPLQDQQVLTEEELLQRRKAKVLKLLQLYKLQYYRLQDNLQSTYELYNKKVTLEREKMGLAGEGKRHHGKGAIDKRNKPKQDQKQEDQLRALYIHSKEAKVKLDDTIGYCHVPECRLRALAPSDFCRTHILRDPQQQLYIGCTYAKGEWHAARGHTCGQPILRTTQPPLCDAHMDASAEQQELAAALASHKKKNNNKKRKASQLLEERDKDKARERESKTSARKKSAGKGKRKETNNNINKTATATATADWMGITSQNASQFPLALVLAKVDHNVGIIQEKRGLLLDEENKRRQQQQQQQEDSDDVEEEATAAS